jgi:cation transport ATPase
MNFKFDFWYAVGAILSIALGVFTLTGDVQQYIKFSNPLAELFFCVTSLLLGVFMIGAAIEFGTKNNSKLS